MKTITDKQTYELIDMLIDEIIYRINQLEKQIFRTFKI